MTLPLDARTVPLQGTALIEASAGTGKTYTITTLYVRLLLEGRGDEPPLSVPQILVVTFTEAATAELRVKIRDRLRQIERALTTNTPTGKEEIDTFLSRSPERRDADRRVITAALNEFDEAAIFTIHGFCQRMLRENAFESGVPLDVELVTTQSPTVGEVVRDFWTLRMADAPEVLVRYVRDAKVGVEALERLAGRVLAHADLVVLPPRDDAERARFDAVLAEWRAARALMAAAWLAGRDAIVDLLCTSEALKRGSYQPGVIMETWVPALDAAAVAESATLTNEDWFERLTPAGVAARTRVRHTPPASPFFDACEALAEAEAALQARLETWLTDLRVDFINFVRAELERRKAAANVQYFDDLVLRLARALETPDGGPALAAAIRRRFPVALVDEFQDTDPAQYSIFRHVYGRPVDTLVLVGDPKQSIYTFRGADVFAYLAARREVPATAYGLVTNRRATAQLVRAVNEVFKRHAQPFGPEIPFAEVVPDRTDGVLTPVENIGPPLRILFLRRPPREPGKPDKVINKGDGGQVVTVAVAAEIAHLLSQRLSLDERPLAPGDVAVLCRTNRQAADVQEALGRLRVPSVLQSTASVFATREAAAMQRVLAALAEPADGAALRAALSTDLLGQTASELFALAGDPEGWDAWLQRAQKWHEVWLHQGFLPAFRRLLDDTGAFTRLLSLPDGERRMTNVLHLAELLHRAEAEGRGGPDVLGTWLFEMRQGVHDGSELAGDAAQMRLESDADAVKLVTVHRSKGLEYPVVFCPYLWEGKHLRDDDEAAPRFHDDHRQLTIDVGSSDLAAHLARAQSEALNESVRVLYVALTRAREHCVVVWGAFRDAEKSPLARVFHGHGGGDEDSVQLGADEELLADLEALAERSAGAIGVEELVVPEALPYQSDAVPVALACRHLRRSIRISRRISSFSGLIVASPTEGAEAGVDHDAADDAVVGVPRAARDKRTVPLAEFPRGTRAGQMVHRVFERLDFPSAAGAELDAVVAGALAADGVDGQWQAPLGIAVTAVLDAPLGIPEPAGGGTVALRSLRSDQCMREMEFVFPVAVSGDPAGALTPARLAEVFARHAAPATDPAAVDRIRTLGFQDLRGFLRGFIDLVFEHGGRWYVVDYKSNALGPRPDDYRPECLRAAMRKHHYYLQYHLYVVALHRYLALRLPHYDYDRDFGGVFYLFLRGMGPPSPPGNGVVCDRPARALVEDLSAMLANPGSERRS